MDGILTTSSAKATAEAWLDDFGEALAAGDAARIAGLFRGWFRREAKKS